MFQGHTELVGQAFDEFLVPSGEGVGPVVAEVQGGHHVVVPGPDGYGQPAAHQAPVGQHPVGPGRLLIVGPDGHVVDPQRMVGPQDPGQDRGPSHRRDLGEVLPGQAGEGDGGPLPGGGEEQSEAGTHQLAGGFGHPLGEPFGVELGQERREAQEQALQAFPFGFELLERPAAHLQPALQVSPLVTAHGRPG